MEKVWLSTTYYMDPAVEELTPNAERLMTRAIAYCGNAENGGKITRKALANLGIPASRSRVAELCAAKILVETDDPNVLEFRTWGQWQESGDALARRKKADRERKARERDRKKRQEEEGVSRDMSRDVRATEKRREENIPTYVGSSSHVSNAGEADSRPSSGRVGYEDPKTGHVVVVESDPVLDIDVNVARGPAVDPTPWKLIRDAIPVEHPQSVKTALALEVKMLLAGGTTHEDVKSALVLWMQKPGLGPRTLPSLVSEVIRTRSAPARTAAARPSTTDARVAAVQEAKAAERTTGRRSIFAVGSNEPAELAQ
ncbi:hypothetical protein [Rhodococcoides fascians]|uniref:hypothetical protein n=1 Tax=Rhodococcoides fascians TaxID=1828 RepID=UPI00069155BA|nr:hypothetical protein [Rhodococcus fascians]